jgi:hypothetical protein
MDGDQVEAIALGTARRLAGEYGPRLETDVEAALYARGRRGVETYDPVAIAGLVVAIASLAWQIYSDLRRDKPDAAPEVVRRTLRHELRRQADITSEGIRISEVIVDEIVEGADPELE